MNKISLMVLFSMILISTVQVEAQKQYNPLVTAPDLHPTPFGCLAESGKGKVQFKFGMLTSENAHYVSGDELTITISLLSIKPLDVNDPLSSLSGSGKVFFIWQYAESNNTFFGTQKKTIPGLGGGDIVIDVKVSSDTDENTPLNGFSANIQPAGYMNGSNNTNDDNISSYTYTKCGVPQCPELSTTITPIVKVTNSVCIQYQNAPSGGKIELPTTYCPSKSKLEYSTDNYTWSNILPAYDQKNVITVYTRCNCKDQHFSKVKSIKTDPGKCNPCDEKIWYIDKDGDEYGGGKVMACERPKDGYLLSELKGVGIDDCDDMDSYEFPGQTWYIDADKDKYGKRIVISCERPYNGFLKHELLGNGTDDCDDNNGNINPGKNDVPCNGIDEDCSGGDSTSESMTWYKDADGDGYGDPNKSKKHCLKPQGYVSNNTDCDDSNGNVNPGQSEIPCNGIDDDCSGGDDNSALSRWYRDADGDGFGNASISLESCTRPSGYVTNNTDCDDSNGNVNPGQSEIPCNGIDDDCSGGDDNSALSRWYRDADGDGFGNASISLESCSRPSGYVSNITDCDDSDANEKPNQVWYIDADNDGFGNSTLTTCARPGNGHLASELQGITDCDDTNDSAHKSNECGICGPSDNDCDDDGAPRGEDCDDNDPNVQSINACDICAPVDNDCDNDGSPIGEDCDDNDPRVQDINRCGFCAPKDDDCDNDGIAFTSDCNDFDRSKNALDNCGICGGDGSSCETRSIKIAVFYPDGPVGTPCDDGCGNTVNDRIRAGGGCLGDISELVVNCSSECGIREPSQNDNCCCGEVIQSRCQDGLDNDDDGLLDCADPDCFGIAPCPEERLNPLAEKGFFNCQDGIDNDGDGLVDCYDPDCRSLNFCHEGLTDGKYIAGRCQDNVDNDKDGLLDCLDPKCKGIDGCP